MKNRLHTIPLKAVTVRDHFWTERIALLAREVIPYQWDALNDNIAGAEPSHAVENLRIAAGKSDGRFQGMVFQDSDVAKWIEAASYSLIAHPNPGLEAVIDELVELIAAAQQSDGYLNTYYTVAEPDQRWKNFSFGHELYSAGHLAEAAVAYYQATGKRKLLDRVCRAIDYIDSVIGPEASKLKAYCGHPEIELALVKLYRATGEQRYLRLCQYFVDERGQQPCFLEAEPAFGNGTPDPWFAADYHQAHAPVREQQAADGHAVRAMYLYAGMADLALETGDPGLIAALRRLWENVTGRRMYITGAIGSQAHGERFTFDYDLPNDTAYAETCAAIGLIFWAGRMLLLEPDRRYADVLERALYNGVLSGISLDGRKYFYVNPLEVQPEAAARRYDLRHVRPERQQWFGCACCPPNIARLVTSLGQYLYSLDDQTLYVHLYVGSQIRVALNGTPVGLELRTRYPWEEQAVLEVEPEQPAEFAIALRIPGWCRHFEIRLNGQPLENPPLEKGYLKLSRRWTRGDRIELRLAMPVELIRAHPRVREDAGKVAIQRGPIVYCLEEVDNGGRLWDVALPEGAQLSCEFSEELGGMVAITGQALRSDTEHWGEALYRPAGGGSQAAPIRAVPYCLWGNRRPGEMTVWIAQK
ncbi:hypothetical protein EDC14_10106 [Hydrogenispora ethanolica]|jgi:DUF1680 family protein|uniref:Glycoside hydrolase family 127 protein n=1 Tax=Hydrogenispora ethanolica TaxID=1082276 RepID=A0A4V2QF01_HYDET|nr:beta-L-arabinofuranosidase domain-containing protein [Hydrogenispora ethanolica]TCL70017.1 hypothetical protein EDC14_10106 [Hydrogenispora ethanolica]